MKAQSVSLNNTAEGKALLQVTSINGEYRVVELSPDQVLLIAQQALSVIWGTYKLVVRDGFIYHD